MDAAGGAAAVAVVASGHHQLGEESEVGQLLTLRGGGESPRTGCGWWAVEAPR